jgi:NTP pyrophosphatase (non-canonical NTP hydrolase)
MSLNELADKHFEWVERMGWHNKTVLEYLALICSEVGEAINECRGKQPTEKFGTELADIILRTVDLAKQHGIDLDKVVADKMALNEINGTRGRII